MKKSVKPSIRINRDEFYAYEGIRRSGFTNMFDLDMVVKLSAIFTDIEILDRDKIIEIMSNYDLYVKLYPIPEDGLVQFKKITRHQQETPSS